MSNATQLVPLKFYDDTIFYIEKDDKPFTPVKFITDNLGIAWQPQHRKLTSYPKRWSITMMMMETGAGPRDMVFLPLRKLPAFLLSIDTRKVNPEIRQKLELYQEECDQVLWDYWTKGHACHPGFAAPAGPDSRDVAAPMSDRYTRLLEKYTKLLEEKLKPKPKKSARRPLTNESWQRSTPSRPRASAAARSPGGSGAVTPLSASCSSSVQRLFMLLGRRCAVDKWYAPTDQHSAADCIENLKDVVRYVNESIIPLEGGNGEYRLSEHGSVGLIHVLGFVEDTLMACNAALSKTPEGCRGKS